MAGCVLRPNGSSWVGGRIETELIEPARRGAHGAGACQIVGDRHILRPGAGTMVRMRVQSARGVVRSAVQ